jgi:CRISPR-associated protein (TIGR03986 family)
MSTLKVPYNFVPLNEKVVSPYWIDHISHDVPFKDGKSGTLRLTLTAESPIFIRRGEAKPPKDNKEKSGPQKVPYEFERDADDNYFLPGSSLRGMVRSVVETLSFGRMIGRVSERRYALRDLSGSMKDEYLSHFKANLPDHQKIRGGWLRYDKAKNQYLLRDADVPGRISHRELQDVSGVTISDYFSGRSFDQTKDEEKAAKRKHGLFAEQQKDSWLRNVLDFTEGISDNGGRKICTLIHPKDDSQTKYPGRLVMTGQPGPRKLNIRKNKWEGKHLEFVFWEFGRPYEIIVPEQIVEDFKFAYFDDNAKEQSIDYEWRSEQLKKGEEIPVFWKQGTDQGTVEHFGLSYLYKLPYNNTVEDSIRDNQDNAEDYDLADAIFGMVGAKGEKSPSAFLKGRVQFSHARMTAGGKVKNEEKVILGEPRASFYPTYMQQKVRDNGQTGRYQTFMDEGPIAGRKRYPVLEEGTRKTREKDEKGKPLREAVFTKFLPLDKGTTFTCELHYHNLRDVELGALLSALTFHGTDKSRHQIGMAKPLGFGKVKVTVEPLSKDAPAKDAQADLMLRYEAFMDLEVGAKEGWRNSTQVKEIVALTNPVEPSRIEVLEGAFPYNTLNEFRQVKNASEALPLHSKMRGDGLETGLKNDLSKKQDFQAEILADKARFDSIQPITSERAKQLTDSADQKVRQALQEAIQVRVEAYRQQLSELKELEELAGREARRKERRADASASGLDLSGVIPHRDAIKKLKKTVDDYLEKLRSKKTRDFTAEDWLLPETDWEELTSKVREIHASGKAKRDFENAKRSVKTQEILARYLGDKQVKSLWKDLTT